MDREQRELLLLLVSFVFFPATSYGVIRLDERYLSPARLARAWPVATRALAVMWFGPLALVFHFTRTRGSFASLLEAGRKAGGLVLGLVAAAVVTVAGELVVEGLAKLLGLPV